jgi:hypothetical protein
MWIPVFEGGIEVGSHLQRTECPCCGAVIVHDELDPPHCRCGWDEDGDFKDNLRGRCAELGEDYDRLLEDLGGDLVRMTDRRGGDSIRAFYEED